MVVVKTFFPRHTLASNRESAAAGKRPIGVESREGGNNSILRYWSSRHKFQHCLEHALNDTARLGQVDCEWNTRQI